MNFTTARKQALRDIADAVRVALVAPAGGELSQAIEAIETSLEELRTLRAREEGSNNPLQRPVVTPRGRYRNVAAASSAHGITRQAGWQRASKRVYGWRFENDTSPQPPKPKRGPKPK